MDPRRGCCEVGLQLTIDSQTGAGGGPVEKRTLEDVLEAYRENGSSPSPDVLLAETLRDFRSDVKALAIEWLEGVFDHVAVHESAIFLSSQSKLFDGESAVEGKPAIVNHHAEIIAGFARPDVSIEHVFVDGPRASVHWKLRDGKAAGSGTDNSSRRITSIHGNTLFLFQDARIAEIRHYTDRNTGVSP